MDIIEIGDIKWKESPKENVIGYVYRQNIINEKLSKSLRVGLVTFSPGARMKDHIHHDTDQILYVTDGLGIISSAGQEQIVSPGMVVHIPMGEKHWHGATKNMSFTHISIHTPGKTTHFD